jgi:2-polyprenyl-6-methoxyphenol hydroxylase-like FAD-dependent oxidoreductase
MRVAIAGAGLAGLATAAALSRAGHEVAVFEQADGLRASGLAINVWSNATTLLPGFGIPADRIPGEPFSRMLMRAAGRDAACAELPPAGLPHVTVERAELLSALADVLPPGTVRYGTRCDDVGELAAAHDLVVIADGAHSSLRAAVAAPPRRRWGWTVWQASFDADLPGIPAGACTAFIRPGFFSGIYRLGGNRVTWFAEQPSRKPGEGRQLLRELADDQDPVMRGIARATPPQHWTEWRAQDLWPGRTFHRGSVVLAGDAAHAMLPTLGQGACQAIEDAAALAGAIAASDNLDQALRSYDTARIRRVRAMVALSRIAAMARRPNPAGRAIPGVLEARLTAAAGGSLLRRISRPAAS